MKTKSITPLSHSGGYEGKKSVLNILSDISVTTPVLNGDKVMITVPAELLSYRSQTMKILNRYFNYLIPQFDSEGNIEVYINY